MCFISYMLHPRYTRGAVASFAPLPPCWRYTQQGCSQEILLGVGLFSFKPAFEKWTALRAHTQYVVWLFRSRYALQCSFSFTGAPNTKWAQASLGGYLQFLRGFSHTHAWLRRWYLMGTKSVKMRNSGNHYARDIHRLCMYNSHTTVGKHTSKLTMFTLHC